MLQAGIILNRSRLGTTGNKKKNKKQFFFSVILYIIYNYFRILRKVTLIDRQTIWIDLKPCTRYKIFIRLL